MADFSPVEALTKKYGPFPGYVWFGIIAVVAFFWMKTQQTKRGTLNEDGESGGDGESEFSSTVESDDGKGNKTSYTASAKNGGGGGGWAFGQPIAGPMGYSGGDVYVNLPGGGTETKTQNTYKVGTGETLHTIARKLFGSSDFWRDLYRANAALIGEDPWKDISGLVLVIPDGETQATDGVGFDIPKYSETSKADRHELYGKYQTKEPRTLAKILNKWADENASSNPKLAASQRTWANKLIGN